MKYAIALIGLILFSSSSFSQVVTSQKSISQGKIKQTIFTTVTPGETKTLTINVSSIEKEVIGQFKSDLQFYKEKVIEISLNETQTKLIVTYNEYMLKEDLIRVFNKHNISYQLKKQADQISNNNSQ